jgi:SAM-dependent methyltransferase
MHSSFLHYLCDPQTGEPLTLHVQSGTGDVVHEGRLASPSNTYPIVRGIPRFHGYDSRNDYTQSFGYQWTKWSRVQFESQNLGKPMQGHTLDMWQRITSISCELAGKVVADFGCGPGRFIEIVRMKQGKVIGLDLSLAVEAAADNFRGDPDVLICQADILKPPIKAGSLDGAFSIGVLHHTPDPRQGFDKMVQAVRAGGWVALSVYGKGTYYDFPTVRMYRGLFRILWPLFRHYPALLYSYFAGYVLRPLVPVPVLGKLVRLFFPVVGLPDVNWSILDTFDSVTPTYQSAHESFEVFQWFKESRLVKIEPSNWGFTAYHGMKS